MEEYIFRQLLFLTLWGPCVIYLNVRKKEQVLPEKSAFSPAQGSPSHSHFGVGELRVHVHA